MYSPMQIFNPRNNKIFLRAHFDSFEAILRELEVIPGIVTADPKLTMRYADCYSFGCRHKLHYRNAYS